MIIVKIVFSLLTTLLVFYFYWKKLKNDYTPHLIFNTAAFSLAALYLFYIIGQYAFPSYSFWFGFTGSLAGLLLGVRKYRLRFFEATEAWVLGSLGVLFMFFSFKLLTSFRVFNLPALAGVAIMVFLYFFIDSRYKRFTWYKSGRVGFTGLFISAITFLIAAMLAIFSPGMVFLQGKTDAILAGSASFIFFILLFNLSNKLNN